MALVSTCPKPVSYPHGVAQAAAAMARSGSAPTKTSCLGADISVAHHRTERDQRWRSAVGAGQPRGHRRRPVRGPAQGRAPRRNADDQERDNLKVTPAPAAVTVAGLQFRWWWVGGDLNHHGDACGGHCRPLGNARSGSTASPQNHGTRVPLLAAFRSPITISRTSAYSLSPSGARADHCFPARSVTPSRRKCHPTPC